MNNIEQLLQAKKYNKDTYAEHSLFSEYGNYIYHEYSKIINNYDIKILIPINDLPESIISHVIVQVFDFYNAITIESRKIDSRNHFESTINNMLDYWERKANLYGRLIEGAIKKSSGRTYVG